MYCSYDYNVVYRYDWVTCFTASLHKRHMRIASANNHGNVLQYSVIVALCRCVCPIPNDPASNTQYSVFGQYSRALECPPKIMSSQQQGRLASPERNRHIQSRPFVAPLARPPKTESPLRTREPSLAIGPIPLVCFPYHPRDPQVKAEELGKLVPFETFDRPQCESYFSSATSVEHNLYRFCTTGQLRHHVYSSGVTEGTVRLIIPNGEPMDFRRGEYLIHLLNHLEKKLPGARLKDHSGYEVTPTSPNLPSGDYLVVLPQAGKQFATVCIWKQLSCY